MYVSVVYMCVVYAHSGMSMHSCARGESWVSRSGQKLVEGKGLISSYRLQFILEGSQGRTQSRGYEGLLLAGKLRPSLLIFLFCSGPKSPGGGTMHSGLDPLIVNEQNSSPMDTPTSQSLGSNPSSGVQFPR